MTANRVVITDVGPRDGLQNQPKILTIEQRLALVQAIADAGVPQIEVGSFVSPKAVPAMAGTDQVFASLEKAQFATPTIALIPNMKGYELARAAGAKTVTMVLYASDGMAQKNASMTCIPYVESILSLIKKVVTPVFISPFIKHQLIGAAPL